MRNSPRKFIRYTSNSYEEGSSDWKSSIANDEYRPIAAVRVSLTNVCSQRNLSFGSARFLATNCIEWGIRQPSIVASGFRHIANAGSATDGLESCQAPCTFSDPTPERLQQRGEAPRDDELHWRGQQSAPTTLDRRSYAPRQRAILLASRHA